MSRCELRVIRTVDVCFAIFGLIFLLPIFIVVACVLAVSGEREVFYLQERVGANYRSFRIIKFATMLKRSMEMAGGAVTLENDPRVTKIGRFLRATKINELPQLLNVLFGDMSLIGPRPLVESSFASYSSEAQDLIVSVRPGISSLNAIYFKSEEKLVGADVDEYFKTILPAKEQLEVYLVEHFSFKLYCSTLIGTLLAIFSPKCADYLRDSIESKILNGG